MDNYYLNNAVYLIEDVLKAATNPPYGGEIDYGDRAEHCWNGDHTRPNAESRLRYHQMFAPKIVSSGLQPRNSAPVSRAWVISASVLRLVSYGPLVFAFDSR